MLRKKTAIVASLAAAGVLALSAGSVLADQLPPGMPDLPSAPEAKAKISQTANFATRASQGDGPTQGHTMQMHGMAMRGSTDRDGSTGMPAMGGGGC